MHKACLLGTLLVVIPISAIASDTYYVYDDLDRLKSVQFGDGSAIVYDYDKIGNLLSKTALPSAENPPPVTTASIPGGIFNQSQTVTLTCVDAMGSACDKVFYTTDGTVPTALSSVYSAPISIPTATTLAFFGVTKLGRAETPKSYKYIVDMVPPTVEAVPSGGLYNSAKSVVLNCYDTGGAGCDKTYYTTDGSEPTTSSSVYASPLSISTATTLKYFSKDKAGNSDVVNQEIYSIDTAAPTGTVTINNDAIVTNNTAVTLNLTCNDANGCAQMQLGNNIGVWGPVESFSNTRSWVLDDNRTSKTDTRAVNARFIDTAGNVSASVSDTILLDKKSPMGSVIINTGAIQTNSTFVILNLACNDTTSGCAQMKISNDNITWSTAETYVTTKNWTLESGDGTKTVFVEFCDGAGNWSKPNSDTIQLISQ